MGLPERNERDGFGCGATQDTTSARNRAGNPPPGPRRAVRPPSVPALRTPQPAATRAPALGTITGAPSPGAASTSLSMS
ncbi:hypothetical protein GCM10010505_50120 [Kitasatospora aburaviensis]